MIGLALKGISKRFGDTVVLDNVSLDIGANEFLVVLGPSGCGKSTLLRAIAGLESIDSGAIEIDGHRVDHLPPGKRGVAMVFQSYALYPHMTVRENISFGLVNVGVARTEIERRIAEVARMLEMQPLLNRLPAELSGGQRQRVAIGRAIVKEPKVFMFDEPLSNLDAALRSRTRQEIANLHRRIQKTMVFVTHDQTEAMTLAHRIVVMNRQRIEQVGTPSEIYSRPCDPVCRHLCWIAGNECAGRHPSRRCGCAAAGATGRRHRDSDRRTRGSTRCTGAPFASACGRKPLQLCAPGTGLTSAKVDFAEFMGDKTYVYLSLAKSRTSCRR